MVVTGYDSVLQVVYGIAEGCRGGVVGVGQLQLVAARCQRSNAQQEGK